MATIDSVKLPDNSTYDLTDNYSGYQTETLATPITVAGTSKTTVEGALDGINAYVDDTVEAAFDVYGSKNINIYPYYETTKSENNVTFTDNEDGTITVTTSGAASANTVFTLHQQYTGYNAELDVENGAYILDGCPENGSASTYKLDWYYRQSGSGDLEVLHDYGSGGTMTINGGYYSDDYVLMGAAIVIYSGTTLPANGITFKPMIRDARVKDGTFSSPAKTNRQLTNDKAERKDMTTIFATGNTNNTGAQIDAGTFFYLNGQFCKALTNIAVNATFTLNTNFKVDSVGEELKNALDYSGVYIFNATPGYEGWGGMYVPTPLPIPAKLLSDYTITISDIKIGRNNGANITLQINSLDIYEKTHGGTNITRTLIDYFQSTSPVYSSFVALRDANATILVKLSVAHT